tara:strand:- start:48019 stop:50184 length:2166 start_codon:yes stop_codon:yes gene_type:complete
MVLIRVAFVVLLLLFNAALANNPLLFPANDKAETVNIVPNPFTLTNGWWRYIEISNEDLDQRALNLKTVINKSVDVLRPELKKELYSLVQQIDLTLNEIVAHASAAKPDNSIVHVEKLSYSVSEFQSLFENYHELKASRDRILLVQRNEADVAAKAEQKAIQTFVEYHDIKDNSERKLKLGLTIMANRLSWYLWKIQSPEREKESDILLEKLEQLLEEIDYASVRITADDQQLNALDEQTEKLDRQVKRLNDEVILARDSHANVIGLDFLTRLTEQLLEQGIIIAEIEKQDYVLKLSILKSIKSLILLQRDNSDIEDDPIEILDDNIQLLKNLKTQTEHWVAQTTNERTSIEELLSSGFAKDENKQAGKLIDDRISVIKETVQALAGLEKTTFNLQQLTSLLEKNLGKSKGWIFKLRTTGMYLFDQTGGKIWALLNARLFELSDAPVTTWDILRAVLILFATFYVARFLQKSIIKYNTNSEGKIPPAFYTLSRVVFYTSIVLGIFIAFSSIGINFTNLAIVAGALSVGIGFGLQSIVNNFVSGIIILFEHNIKIGDFIELDTGLKGTVRDINVRSTIVNTLDNLDIIVPNSELVTAKVTNYTLNEPIVRIHVPFGVAYGTDKELVRRVVLEASKKVDISYDDGVNRRTQVWLVGFGDSSLNFELVVWLNPKLGRAAPGSWKAIYTWEIETALKEHNIEIPFPQRDLHIKSGLKEAIKPEAI